VPEIIACLYCNAAATITVTAELSGVLAHYPCCDNHVERAARQMRAERGRQLAGLDPFTGELATMRRPMPGSIDAV
jgi:hypothetical protein